MTISYMSDYQLESVNNLQNPVHNCERNMCKVRNVLKVHILNFNGVYFKSSRHINLGVQNWKGFTKG